MHRNFMGYTTTQSKLIIGLGASSISDAWTAFAQNEDTVEEYQQMLNRGALPLKNGHLLNQEDLFIRRSILDLMCKSKTILDQSMIDSAFLPEILHELSLLNADGLVETEQTTITVTEKGNLFIRNICAVLDARLRRKKKEGNVFSKSI
jgi:oxygen-independent coproporphyrinogen-3 oxidase